MTVAGPRVDMNCPVCGEQYVLDSEGVPSHVACAHDGDHDVCEPDDRHIPR